jgi:hypothetical protein
LSRLGIGIGIGSGFGFGFDLAWLGIARLWMAWGGLAWFGLF